MFDSTESAPSAGPETTGEAATAPDIGNFSSVIIGYLLHKGDEKPVSLAEQAYFNMFKTVEGKKLAAAIDGYAAKDRKSWELLETAIREERAREAAMTASGVTVFTGSPETAENEAEAIALGNPTEEERAGQGRRKAEAIKAIWALLNPIVPPEILHT